MYQIGYTFDVPDRVDVNLPHGRTLWCVNQDYHDDGDGNLCFGIDVSHQDAEDEKNGLDGDLEGETLVTVRIAESDLQEYALFLTKVTKMINDRIARASLKNSI